MYMSRVWRCAFTVLFIFLSHQELQMEMVYNVRNNNVRAPHACKSFQQLHSEHLLAQKQTLYTANKEIPMYGDNVSAIVWSEGKCYKQVSWCHRDWKCEKKNTIATIIITISRTKVSFLKSATAKWIPMTTIGTLIRSSSEQQSISIFNISPFSTAFDV